MLRVLKLLDESEVVMLRQRLQLLFRISRNPFSVLHNQMKGPVGEEQWAEVLSPTGPRSQDSGMEVPYQAVCHRGISRHRGANHRGAARAASTAHLHEILIGRLCLHTKLTTASSRSLNAIRRWPVGARGGVPGPV